MSRGRRVRADTSAIAIARAVRSPNRIVGMKLDSDRIEKPIVIVRDVG